MTEAVLETERLLLRPAGEQDAAFMLRLLNDPAFLRYIGDRGVRTLDAARHYITRGPVASYQGPGYGVWIVELKPERTPAGVCSLLRRKGLDDVDIGFAFMPEARSRGLATESAQALLQYARSDLGLDRVVAYVTPENAASLRVLEKLGLRSEGTTRLSGDDADVRMLATPS